MNPQLEHRLGHRYQYICFKVFRRLKKNLRSQTYLIIVFLNRFKIKNSGIFEFFNGGSQIH